MTLLERGYCRCNDELCQQCYLETTLQRRTSIFLERKRQSFDFYIEVNGCPRQWWPGVLVNVSDNTLRIHLMGFRVLGTTGRFKMECNLNYIAPLHQHTRNDQDHWKLRAESLTRKRQWNHGVNSMAKSLSKRPGDCTFHNICSVILDTFLKCNGITDGMLEPKGCVQFSSIFCSLSLFIIYSFYRDFVH